MAEEIKRTIVIDTKSSSKTIKSLKKDIDLLTSSLEDLEVGSVEYNKTLELLSKRQKSFNEIQEKINKSSFNTVQRWESIARLSSGLAAGYGAATSAITLFGKESENLDRIMVKLQGTIGLVQGIGGLKDLVQELPLVGEAFNKVIGFISPFDKKLTDVATNLNNIDLGKLTTAQNAINSLPTGDINVSVGSGVEEWKELNTQLPKANSNFIAVASNVEELTKKQKVLKTVVSNSIEEVTQLNDVVQRAAGYMKLGATQTDALKWAAKDYGLTLDELTALTQKNVGQLKEGAKAQKELVEVNKALETAEKGVAEATEKVSLSWKALGKSIGISLLITAVIALVGKIWDYITSLKTARQEQAEFNKAIYESANAISSKTLVAFKQLQQAYSNVGDSAQAKQQFLKDYADQIEETGLRLNTVNDLDAAFINNTDAYVNAIMARAKAQAIENKAIEIYEEFLNKRSELEESITSGEASSLTLGQKIQQGILGGSGVDLEFIDKAATEQSIANVKKVEDEIVSITEETNKKLLDMFNEIAELNEQYAGFFNVKKVKGNGESVKVVVDELDNWLKAREESQLTAAQKLGNEYARLKELAKDNDIALLEIEVWYQEELSKLRKKAAEDALSDVKKEGDDRWKALQDELKRIRDLSKTSNLSSPEDREYTTRYKQSFAKTFGLSGQFTYQSKDDLQRQYDDQVAYNNELFNLTKTRIDQENELLNKSLQDEALNADRKLEIRRILKENEIALEDAALKKEKGNTEAYKSLQDAKNQALQSTLSVASNIAGSMAQIWGEETKVGKGFATAQALIDTYSAANAAYSAMAGIPIVGPGLGVAAAAAAIIAGIANVKSIWAVNESGSTVTSTPSITAPPAITTPPIEYTRNLLGDKEIDALNQPVKCYVLESDITNAQNKVSVTEDNASF